ncbi:ArsR family transcriptional regulator [Anaerotruncus sp. 1XD22-93]|nr:ArsR family transcriptional regulator [Lachnospiraceae bacterium]NBI76315.1 ArsR family transcriptional regulator [Lachnospiraceae bacterium]RKJ81979.1 ArsR family transcriptional regulator [Anaerotruncus sp. 1XD22-93]
MTDIELLHLVTAPTRYQIITLLLDYHYCVKAIATKLGISEPAVSQQMNVLKECGLVTGERLDYQMHYTVNHELLKKAANTMKLLLVASEKKQGDIENCDCEFAATCNRRGTVKKS